MKYVSFFILLIFGAVTSISQASLKSEMFKMEYATKALLAAENVEIFKQSAADFIQAVESSLPHLPGKILEDDERAIDDYHRAMQELIEVTNNAVSLAENGELAQAKEMARQLFRLKSFYHLQYK